jgi:hypothetical protein
MLMLLESTEVHMAASNGRETGTAQCGRAVSVQKVCVLLLENLCRCLCVEEQLIDLVNLVDRDLLLAVDAGKDPRGREHLHDIPVMMVNVAKWAW